MSKIGQQKINIADNVQVVEENRLLTVTGPKGELTLELPRRVKLEKDDRVIQIVKSGNDRQARAFHGLFRKLIANMVEGVSVGFTKKLDFKGVGFRVEVQEKKLILNVGFSHPVEYTIPEEIEVKVEKNVIIVSGIDRQKVGQVAAEIRRIKPVEPYKGKGIKYIDEIPRRKQGKAAKAAIGGAK